MTALIDIQLFTLLAIMAFVIARHRDLFTSAMLLGIFSLICASLFVVMDAVDVAFTEAAVGAGISTVLFISALSLTTREETSPPRFKPLALAIVLITGGALVYGTLDMPRYGDPKAPIHHHVAPTYMKESYKKTHIPNVVTTILASYRGYDTMGEVTVIFTAGVGVLLLLGAGRRPRTKEEEEEDTEEASENKAKEKEEQASEAKSVSDKDSSGNSDKDSSGNSDKDSDKASKKELRKEQADVEATKESLKEEKKKEGNE